MRTQAALATNQISQQALTRAGWMTGRDEPLRATGAVVDIPEGREICAEGDGTESFYKVVSGVVRVCKFLNDGRRQIEAFHVPGEMFGLELGGERLLSAEAVSACSIIVYRRRSVEQQARTDQAVSQQLFQHAMAGLMQAQAHSLLLGRRGAAEKVAAFLLDWSAKAPEKGSLHLVMSRQDMADYLGLTIETVSRSMSQFERDGVIALSGARHVHILNRSALESLAS
jgi:CRP/FNR family transcriptional regulator, nitrogen fixation regulation protein